MNLSFITSRKPTSLNKGQFAYYVSIDKMVIDLREKDLSREELLAHLKRNKVLSDQGSFKNEQGRVNIIANHDNGANSYFRTIGLYGAPCTLILNPSHFSCATEFLVEIDKILPGNGFRNTNLSRVDLTIDIQGSFEEVIKQIDVKYKRISNHSTYSGSKIDFVSFGKSSSGEYVKIYDKSESLNISNITRLEIQLKNPKLKRVLSRDPLIALEELNSTEFHEHTRNPLNNVRLIDYELTPTNTGKKLKLEGSLRIAPLSIIRRRLNPHSNFSRDYRKVLKIKEQRYQPREIYQIGIKEWFEKGY